MTDEMRTDLPMGAILDSLVEQIAVITQDGVIRYVNLAWLNFGRLNGVGPEVDWIGLNYLTALHADSVQGDLSALRAKNGIEDVLAERIPIFSFEYPCNGRGEKRWFEMRICVLASQQNLFVVSHHNITQLKLAEERLEYLSRHDSLTDMANRRYLETCLQDEWKRGMRQRMPVGLIMVDIDHFKDYNDYHGHLEGDRCLRKVAEVLHFFSRRPGDLAARFGGEEFVLILANTTLQQAHEIAEAIRLKVQALGIFYGEQKPLTVSLGVVSEIPATELPELLVKQADSALYKAKQSGRNRVELG